MTYKTYIDNLQDKVATCPDTPFLHQPINRQWKTFSWAEVDRQARIIAAGLKSKGFAQGASIGILAKNCAEWFIVDVAISMAGMISVPIYTTANEKTISYVIEHSDMKAIFVGKLDDGAEAIKAIPSEILTIAMPYPTIDCNESWQQWLQDYAPLDDIHRPALDDVMTLVYTSGSTGVPKGVTLTHKNLASAVHSTIKALNVTAEDRSMSYLPLAHITERSVIEGVGYEAGWQVFFVESLDTFIEDVQHAEPTMFVSVPRLWLKFQSQIQQKMPEKKLRLLLKIPILGNLVALKIRKALGLHKAKMFGSGTAPISESVLRWYNRIGINISEGWGMTEASGLACCTFPFSKDSLGTIGTPLECVEMKLSDDKEILIRGDAIFSGYYRNPEETEKGFVDGWFRTGDCGELLESGCFKITGRIKEQFKTAKGKYVAPVPIESQLFNNSNIEQACVVGAGMRQPIALIVLSENCTRFDPELEKELERTLSSVNKRLESHERLEKVVISQQPWSIENELLTPTMKIKRQAIEDKFNELLSRAPEAKVVWEEKIV